MSQLIADQLAESLRKLRENYPSLPITDDKGQEHERAIQNASGADTQAMWAEADEALERYRQEVGCSGLPRSMPIPFTGNILRRCECCARFVELPSQLCLVGVTSCTACAAEKRIRELMDIIQSHPVAQSALAVFDESKP